MIDVAPPTVGLAQHSAASADWGTPEVGRRFAGCVLAPSAMSESIDLDYASSAYWHQWWPGKTRPLTYLDGSPGKDVLVDADRRAATTGHGCGAGFMNAPGLNGGAMVQSCWAAMEADHRSGWLKSGMWWGFSIEQFASLQGVAPRNPLTVGKDDLITTIVPSRRARYILHPESYIALIEKKLARRKPDSKEAALERKLIAQLRTRSDDSPVQPAAPPHSSYITILWNKDRTIRRRQMEAARAFIRAQKDQDRSLFQEVAVVGEML